MNFTQGKILLELDGYRPMDKNNMRKSINDTAPTPRIGQSPMKRRADVTLDTQSVFQAVKAGKMGSPNTRQDLRRSMVYDKSPGVKLEINGISQNNFKDSHIRMNTAASDVL